MGILGISNRTENWQTALYFSPFFTSEHARIRLAKQLLRPSKCPPGEVKLELYWKGMRDYLHEHKDKVNAHVLADLYRHLFPDLHLRVRSFNKLQSKNAKNYGASPCYEGELRNNLVNTEIDIVLESKTHLFIGEAKDESGFGANGNLILVHQLIRQYVMAKILVELQGVDKQVVPFVVWDQSKGGRLPFQLQFMTNQGWMDNGNIITWAEVEGLARES